MLDSKNMIKTHSDTSDEIKHMDLFAEELEDRYNAQTAISMFPIGAIILGSAILLTLWFVMS